MENLHPITNAIVQNNDHLAEDNATKQGDKLPNTATHYPASILMGLSTFLVGMLLFIRRKNVK